MSVRFSHLPALSRFGALALALVMALVLLILPPPALRAGGAEQAAVLVQGQALSAPARLAAAKAPKAEPEDLPPLALLPRSPAPVRPSTLGRLVVLVPPTALVQRRVPGHGARAPPVFSDRST